MKESHQGAEVPVLGDAGHAVVVAAAADDGVVALVAARGGVEGAQPRVGVLARDRGGVLSPELVDRGHHVVFLGGAALGGAQGGLLTVKTISMKSLFVSTFCNVNTLAPAYMVL